MADEWDINRAGTRRGEFIPNFSVDVTSEGINDLHRRMVRLQQQFQQVLSGSVDQDEMKRAHNRMNTLEGQLEQLKATRNKLMLALLGAIAVAFTLIILQFWIIASFIL